eukprot:CFRG5541T1
MLELGVVLLVMVLLVYWGGMAQHKELALEFEVASSRIQLHRLVCNREKMNELSPFVKKDVVVETVGEKTKTVMKQDVEIMGMVFNPTIHREYKISNEEGKEKYEELELAWGFLGSFYSKTRKIHYEELTPNLTKYCDHITISSPRVFAAGVCKHVEKNHRKLGKNVVEYIADKRKKQKQFQEPPVYNNHNSIVHNDTKKDT